MDGAREVRMFQALAAAEGMAGLRPQPCLNSDSPEVRGRRAKGGIRKAQDRA